MSSPSEEPNQTSKTFERKGARKSMGERGKTWRREYERKQGEDAKILLYVTEWGKKKKTKGRDIKWARKRKSGKTEGKGPQGLIEVSLDFGKCSHADGVNKYWTGISHHLEKKKSGLAGETGFIGKQNNQEGKQKNHQTQKKSGHTGNRWSSEQPNQH